MHIYGSGKPNAEKSLLKRVASHGLEDHVLLKGYADLAGSYSNCAFVAFPSKTEGFGMVVLDAAQFAKPSLMIHDRIGCGEVVEPKDLVSGFHKLMSDANYRRKLGAQACAYCAEHYSRARILDRWESLLSACR